MKQFTFLLCLCFLLTSSFYPQAQPGTLDESFGESGITITDFPNGVAFGSQAFQKDEKIVVHSSSLLVRYLPNGTLDASFGENGSVQINDALSAKDIAIQLDDKIVVCGAYVMEGRPNVGLQRFLPDGKVDSSFGDNGLVVTNFQEWDGVNSIAIQPDEKILVSGSISESEISPFYAFVVRYNTNGSLDYSFGNNGIAIVYNTQGAVVSMLLQSDGKIVLGGYDRVLGSSDVKFFITRVTSSGQVDESFGNGGVTKTDFDINGEFINDMCLQNDGKIVVAGSARQWGLPIQKSYMAVARYNSNGSLDEIFGEEGKVKVEFDVPSEANGIAMQENGKIVIAGFALHEGNINFALARLTQNGVLDEIFGDGGKTETDLGSTPEKANDVSIQKSGRIIAGGSQNSNIALAGYEGDATEDPLISKIRSWIKDNAVNWHAQNADKVAYYAVEASKTSNNFKEVKRVRTEVVNNAQEKEDKIYSYAIANGETDTYYRIKAAMLNGRNFYSDVLYYSGSGGRVSVSPNPVRDVLRINGLKQAVNSELLVVNGSGNVMNRVSVKGNSVYNMNVASLKPGTYYLQVQTKEKTEIIKFVKE